MALKKIEAGIIVKHLELVAELMAEVEALCNASIREEGYSHAIGQLLEFSHYLAHGKSPECPLAMAEELKKQIPTLED